MLNTRVNIYGADKAINRIQNGLYAHFTELFPAVNVDGYPRVYGNDTKEGVIAQHYLSNGEYDTIQYFEGSLMFFFLDNEKSESIDFKGYKSDIGIVVFSDLSKLYTEQERMDEKLISDTLDGLHPFSYFFKPKDISKGIDNIMKGFRKDNMQWENMHPKFCFEITGSIEITY